jgi:predicted amidohydrolase YtcJ
MTSVGANVNRILTNGRILTMDAGFSTVEALAIRDNRIIATGRAADIIAMADDDTIVEDLDGAAVIPGMTDAHNHLLNTSLMLTEVQLYDTRSIQEILNRVAGQAARTAPGEWIVGRGWDETLLAEGRFPNRWELDEVAPENPVLLWRVWNKLVCNSAALERAGISRSTPQPTGSLYAGGFDLDDSGEPNGLFRDRAKRMISDHVPEPGFSERHAALAAGCMTYNRLGLTTVIEPGMFPEDLRLYQAVDESGDLSVRTGLMLAAWGYTRPELEPYIHDWISKFGFHSGFGNDRLWIDGAKMCPDGGVGDRTARFYEPYLNDPGNVGQWVIDPNAFPGHARFLHDLGFSIDTHTCGTASQDLAARSYAAAQQANPNPKLHHRMHHAYFPSAEAVQLMGEHGLGAFVSASFIRNLGDSFVLSVGEERAADVMPMRTYLEAGVPVAGTSDAPVSDYNPWTGIWGLITRRTISGHQFNQDEGLTREEALRAYTIWPAEALGRSGEHGSLEPGKLADLAVLSADPLAIQTDELLGVHAVKTMLGGTWVYTHRSDEQR